MAHPRAGQPALPEDLIDVDAVLGAYYDLVPDPTNPDQQVVVRHLRPPRLQPRRRLQRAAHRRDHAGDRRVPRGAGHHRSAVHRQGHPRAVDAGLDHGDRGAGGQRRHPAGRDRGGLHPDAGGVARDRGAQRRPSAARPPQADGIVVTPSHNPPRDGGFKYNPPHGGPADSDATSGIAARANELLADLSGRHAAAPSPSAPAPSQRHDYLGAYCEDLVNALDLRAIREAGVRIGADPMGGASIQYWELHRRAPRHRPDRRQPRGRPAPGPS